MEEGRAGRANRARGRLLQPPVELEAAAVLAEILTTISTLKSPCGLGRSVLRVILGSYSLSQCVTVCYRGITVCYGVLQGYYRVIMCVKWVVQSANVCYRV